jgi:Flp pilus assembly pilin Flp
VSRKILIARLHDRLRLEAGQTMSEYTLVLTVISGTSVFCFTGLSGQVANAVINVARLLP